MSEVAETQSGATAVAPPPEGRPRRLNQAVAWVGIVVGVLFAVAVVFFSGFFMAWASGADRPGIHGPGGHMGGGGASDCCPMMSQGDKMPGGQMGPGMMPNGPMKPGNSPTTSPAPAAPRP
ncbi:hypothetical protein [Mycobacterium sp. 050134]|uniref:hypothetical protein n=1 Tax=Mycobacterium sp. 050134 TaxID=3096111 RepID=UPI002ED93211